MGSVFGRSWCNEGRLIEFAESYKRVILSNYVTMQIWKSRHQWLFGTWLQTGSWSRRHLVKERWRWGLILSLIILDFSNCSYSCHARIRQCHLNRSSACSLRRPINSSDQWTGMLPIKKCDIGFSIGFSLWGPARLWWLHATKDWKTLPYDERFQGQ